MSSLAKIVMRPRGNYKATDTYLSLDWVRYLGKVWVSKIDNNIGHTPEDGEYWALLVQDGSGGSGGDAYWGGITGELEDQTDLKEALDAITDSVELKQDILDTQTPYSQKGTSTKVPQITTNKLGQVTAITEVNIAQYSLPTASTETLGGVKVDGETILIDNNGVISSVGGTGTGDMLKSDYDTNGDYKVDAADVADTLSGLTATITELNYSDGVTSNIQEQLDDRPKIDELHSVAFSGDYDDLNNTPTIPTVVVDKIQYEGVHIADITVSGVKTELYAPTSSGGSTAWGQITGTLSNQSDLQTALDGIDSALDNKVDVISGKGLSTNDYDNTAKGIVDTVTSNLASKVNIAQGTSNVGKILKVNSSGNLELAQYSEGAQIEDTTTSTTSVWSSNKVNSELGDKINEPSSEGTNGQVLTTDGNGGRTWTTVQSSGGDMLKSVYDTDNDGIVDSAETLSGLTASITELNYMNGATENIQAALNMRPFRAELDSWTSEATLASGNTVTFTGLNDSYGYDLYSVDDVKPITWTDCTKTGSGTSMQLTYTVSGSTLQVGISKFVLRVLK